MTVPAYMPDHVAQGLAKLTTPFKHKPLFEAWCRSHLNPIQALEDMLIEFLSAFDADTCDLPRLTILGKLVGQLPVGTLETFRRLVKVRILANKTDTTAPTLIKIAQTLLGGNVYYTDGGCAITIEARVPLPVDVDGAALASILRLAKMGGVSLILIAQNQADSFLLGLTGSESVVDSVHGLSTVAETSGGYLAGVF